MDYNPSPIDLHSLSNGRGGSAINAEDRYADATVTFVDIINNTFDAHSTDGISIFRAVQFAEIMPNHSGNVQYPVSGDTVSIRISKGIPRLERLHRPTDDIDEATGMPMHRFVNHPYLRKQMPGDRWWFGIGGSFLGLLRGGILKLGASPMCQLIFIKFENMVKLITQQWRFISCGVHAYSVNDNGDISTRFSFFRKDAFGKTASNDWPNRSDLDLLIDANGASLLFGPVDEETWTRTNKTAIRLMPNGNVFIGQGDLDNGLFRQKISISTEGMISVDQFNEDMTVCTYHKEIVQCGDFTKVDERMIGDYKLTVVGSYSVDADEGVSITSDARVHIDSDTTVKIKTTFLEHEADIKNL